MLSNQRRARRQARGALALLWLTLPAAAALWALALVSASVMLAGCLIFPSLASKVAGASRGRAQQLWAALLLPIESMVWLNHRFLRALCEGRLAVLEGERVCPWLAALALCAHGQEEGRWALRALSSRPAPGPSARRPAWVFRMILAMELRASPSASAAGLPLRGFEACLEWMRRGQAPYAPSEPENSLAGWVALSEGFWLASALGAKQRAPDAPKRPRAL